MSLRSWLQVGASWHGVGVSTSLYAVDESVSRRGFNAGVVYLVQPQGTGCIPGVSHEEFIACRGRVKRTRNQSGSPLDSGYLLLKAASTGLFSPKHSGSYWPGEEEKGARDKRKQV
ncbi:unnamed protein product [Diplocarpon coronariae]